MSGYIAHPGQTLEAHLLGVGEKAKQFAAKLGLAEQGELIGLLHDLGKYSQAFQNYIRSATGLIDPDEDDYVDAGVLKGKIDHSTAGAQYIWEALSSKGELEKIVAQMLALCVASHHSGLIDCISADTNNFGEDTFSKRMLKLREKTHIDEVSLVVDSHINSRCQHLLGISETVEGIKNLIGQLMRANTKNGQMSMCVAQQQIGLAVRFLFSCLIDADRIDTADSERKKVRNYRPLGVYAAWSVLVERLEEHLQQLPPRNPIDGLRNDISRHCLSAASRSKGVFTLTVPTGGGKTLASLRFALHHAAQRKLDRVIYVIPFTSIIDQNARVVRDILEPRGSGGDLGKIVLEHHSSLTPEQQTWREKILCESWDAPVIYTTMVQFLETLFGPGTRGARRMHQLANSVLIFDEIQTLPINCVHLVNNAINFLAEQCNSTVVLCTATQPLLNEVNPLKGAVRLHEQHEIMPDGLQLFEKLKRVDVRDQRKSGGWNYNEVAQLALNEVERAGSCLVIVNTKDAAKEIYAEARGCLSGKEIYHLSTDMCPRHRKLILALVRRRLKRKQRTLCVSTQLIEAGVDVDFDVVIRSLAGLDSIAQAAGRCNRNGIHEVGVVHVVNLPNERLEKLPSILQGQNNAQRVIDNYGDAPLRYGSNLLGPEALRDYYQYYFFDRQNDMSYSISPPVVGETDTLLNLLAENSQAVNEYGSRRGSKPDIFLKQAFMTAAKAFKSIDAPTQGVIVPYGRKGQRLIGDLGAAFEVEKQYDLLKAAQQYTVNIFPHVMERLRKAEAIYPIQEGVNVMHLDSRYYSDEFGLSAEPVSRMQNGVM